MRCLNVIHVKDKIYEVPYLILVHLVTQISNTQISNFQISNTPSYSNKHNVSLQYIVQFSKLL
jgi:hypothetical protein